MRESISSGHFHVNEQILDAMSWLENNRPEDYAELVKQFPEYPRWKEANAEATKLYPTDDELGLDPDWSCWLVDAIENTGNVWWEDGEPWVGDNTDEDEDEPEDEDAGKYQLNGGTSYMMEHPSMGGETFDSQDAAWYEWKRRRCDWTGRFPCWGDGGPDEAAVLQLDFDGDTIAGYTPRELVEADPMDDLAHYYDMEA